MDLFANVILGFQTAFQPINFLFCFIGVLTGTLVGVLPGLGPVAAMSLLLPTTFHISPVAAIIMLAGIYYGAMYGGSTTSILVNIPGEAASVVTCLDGYQMARKGRAGVALGISAMGSFIGGTLSVVGLMLLTPPLAKLAIGFGPPELFSLIILGLMMVSSMGSGSLVKSLIMATLGLFVSTYARNELQVIQFIPLVLVPQFFLSGLLWPVEQMSRFLQYLSKVMPLTYSVDGLRKIMLEGKSLGDVWVDLVVLAAFAASMTLLGAAALRRGNAP